MSTGYEYWTRNRAEWACNLNKALAEIGIHLKDIRVTDGETFKKLHVFIDGGLGALKEIRFPMFEDFDDHLLKTVVNDFRKRQAADQNKPPCKVQEFTFGGTCQTPVMDYYEAAQDEQNKYLRVIQSALEKIVDKRFPGCKVVMTKPDEATVWMAENESLSNVAAAQSQPVDQATLDKWKALQAAYRAVYTKPEEQEQKEPTPVYSSYCAACGGYENQHRLGCPTKKSRNSP
jgi:hypothetical protein